MKKIVPLLFLLTTINAFSQKDKLGIVAKVEKDRIILRWMPLNYKTWKTGNTNGYILMRRTLEKNKVRDNKAKFTTLTQKPITPLKVDFFQRMGKYNKFALVAGKLLYEEKPTTDSISHDLSFAIAMQMSCMTASIANGMGLLFEDKNIIPGELYEYSVVNSAGNVAFVQASSEQITRLVAPDKLFGDFSDSTFFMRWRVTDELLHTAYMIERSDDGGVSYHYVDENPTLITQEPDSVGNTYATKTDKLPKFYIPYYYRVRAVTPFGQMGEPSKPIQVTGYRIKLPMPVLKQNYIKDKGLMLSWTFPDSLNRDIRGFEVLRTKQIGTKYEYVSPKRLLRTARMYIDSLPPTESYYRIAVVNWAGNEISSYPEFVQLDDSIPPVKPTWNGKRVSPKGIVTLQWHANHESDFLGYRVFKGDNKKTEFSLISKKILSDSILSDTLSLKLLNKKIFYVVVAYDKRLNASVHSDTILVKRPDIFPPATPHFKNYKIESQRIKVFWDESPSDDVVATILLRKGATDSSFCAMATFLATDTTRSFADSTLLPKQEYQYRLVAFDDAGLSSNEYECEVRLALLDEGFKPMIKDLKLTADTTQKTLTFQWKYDDPAVEKYVLYRQKGADSYLGLYKYLEKNIKNYVEKNVPSDTLYSFAVMAIMKDGTETQLTKPMTVTSKKTP